MSILLPRDWRPRQNKLGRGKLGARTFSRRAVLGGAGALLTLPLFESLLSRPAKAQSGEAIKRFLAFYVPDGIHMPAWTPNSTGPGYDLKTILEPLVNVQSKVSVLSGLDNEPARPDGPGDHAAGTGSFLTCAHVKKTEGADIQNGISIDQVIANAIGDATPINSLQLGTQGGSDGGGCDSGYSCAYARNISWASATQPLNKIVNPAVVWDQLFAGLDPEATEEELLRRRHYQKSILDYVREDIGPLKNKLGSKDQQKLDEYLTGVNELEDKINKLANGPQCVVPDRPTGDEDFPGLVNVMIDLMMLGFQCDSTRVMTFMLENAGSYRSHTHLGISEAHHDLSHHDNQQYAFDQLTIIDRWEVEVFARLLEQLEAVDEGDGKTMLDNSILFFSSEIEDGNSHSHFNYPVLLAGGAGGEFNPGRHVDYSSGDKVPIANLFTSIANAMGVELATFGDDGTGPLDNL